MLWRTRSELCATTQFSYACACALLLLAACSSDGASQREGDDDGGSEATSDDSDTPSDSERDAAEPMGSDGGTSRADAGSTTRTDAAANAARDATVSERDAAYPGDGGAIAMPDGGVGYVWPNDQSKANSDPWLSEHHDEIVQMNPRVLLLNYANRDNRNMPFDMARTQTLVDQHIKAWQWASRYHGYNDTNAKPFLNYQMVKIVDLRDQGTGINSAKLPVSGNAVDYARLATPEYADIIGIKDPDDPSKNLSLCGLFEKGVIHEVWGMVADPADIKFAESAENKQAYDANNKPIADRILAVSNGPNVTRAIPCKVSVRIYDFNPTRGAGCHLHAAGHGWENYITRGALPAFSKVASTFFNFDFKTRFNASFTSFYDVCPYDSQICVNWTSSTHATNGPGSSKPFDFADMSAGCGNVHFPANATTQYTTAGDVEVMTSCENYGLGNGSGGKDLTTHYSDKIINALYKGNREIATDCGGAQPTYLYASMPGLGNVAKHSDGTPMKNWWVYYFY
jgi:hypothetical protein